MAINTNQTKRIFADKLRKMLESMPLDKVRVSELCKRCGADRRTFYYHFIDKYDLVAWIYMEDYADALATENGKYTEQHVINLIRKIRQHKVFYKNVYADISQNSIQKYLYKYYYDLGSERLKNKYGIKDLTPEMDYAIRSQFYAVFGIMMDWFQGKVDYSDEEFAHLQYENMPPLLKEAYEID